MRRVTTLVFTILLFYNLSYSQSSVDPASTGTLLAEKEAARFLEVALANAQQTQNQANYDVRYYDIRIEVFPSAEQLVGSVTIHADVVGNAIDRLDVDLLDNMVVDSAKAENLRVAYTHSEDIVTIPLGRSYEPGEDVCICIYYHGSPVQSGLGAFDFGTYNGQPMIWSLSQPFGSRNWWPCKDIPADKADSVDIRITVPSNLVVASNGLLRSVNEEAGKKTYWWHEKYPIVTYLVSITIHPYAMFSDSVEVIPGRYMPIDYYVFPDLLEKSRGDYAITKDMIEVFSNLFGPYPFHEEKYGHAQYDRSGGMEHQTITSLNAFSPSELLIVHELAHHWWGDLITCQDFGHIWLNEGFAHYAEALWDEFYHDKERYWDHMNRNKYFGGGTVYVTQMETSVIFDNDLSYNKASWVLHMLRHIVGDSTFFDILKSYASDSRFRFKTAITEGFQQICEEVSGLNLGDFFHQWIYEEYYPYYEFHHETRDSSGFYVTQVQIRQIQQNTVVFHMPVDLRFQFTGTDTTVVVDNFLADQTYRFVFDEQPVGVELDPDDWILKKISRGFPEPSFSQGILLVNGVSWSQYDDEIRSAYESRAFWGDFSITFWDCFPPPSGGYPRTLPTPVGFGDVPSDILGQYSSVIWVGNNYDGDLDAWWNTAITGYLNAGGNVLLMTRMGRLFFDVALSDYMGIDWEETTSNTLGNCVAVYPGLVDMGFLDIQSANSVFNVQFNQPETVLLFQETESFSENRGLGAWRKPQNGGTYSPQGGQFVFISGRPYRYDVYALRTNVEYILEHFFEESDKREIDTSETRMESYPNPFSHRVSIDLIVPRTGEVTVSIYNVLGQRIKVLYRGLLDSGHYTFIWSGDDERGQQLPAGIYFGRAQCSGGDKVIKIIKVH